MCPTSQLMMVLTLTTKIEKNFKLKKKMLKFFSAREVSWNKLFDKIFIYNARKRKPAGKFRNFFSYSSKNNVSVKFNPQIDTIGAFLLKKIRVLFSNFKKKDRRVSLLPLSPPPPPTPF